MYNVLAQPKRTNSFSQDEADVSVWVPLAAFLLLATAIAVTGVFAFEQYKKGAKSEAQVALDSITYLKIKQIESWRTARREDAEAVANDPFLTRAIESWMRAGRPADARRASILARLEGIAHAHQFSAALIADGQGAIVLTTGLPPPSPAAYSQALDAMRSGQVHWADIHSDGAPGRFAMELIVPVRGERGHPASARSAILFRIDPAVFLFPLIQSWPTRSETAESFLFRQEGDAIVYLNELRHSKVAPLSLRFSATDPNLLAAQLLRGREGALEGEDYRKVPVVGYGHRIADSPWYLLSKIDTREIYAPIEQSARVITMTAVGFVFLSGLAIWLWWRQQRARLRQMRAEIERQALAKHYDYLTRYANDMILLADEQGNIVEANDRAAAVYGYAREELLGKNVRRLGAEESVASVDDDWLRCGPEGRLYETDHRNSDGSDFPVEISGRAIQVKGKVFHQAVIRDISERRQAEANMRLYLSVFETAGDAVVITDAAACIVAVNPAFTEITGYSKVEAIGQNPRVLGSGRQDKAFYERMWDSLSETGRWQGEIWNRRKDGQIYPEWLSISAVSDAAGRVTNYIAIFFDISERKATEEHISFLAQHDALTGLPNRALMADRLVQALGAAQREGDRVALMLIDLDHFKNVNDSLGHPVGDQLLQGVARRLLDSVRQNDTVSRLGGDEFVVILPKISGAEDAALVAEKMLHALAMPFSLFGNEVQITPSIGVCIYPDEGADSDSLIRHADTAMYQAKEYGRNRCQFFTRAMNTRVLERLTMETELRTALARGEFVLHYQPQVDMKNGCVIGVEALVRWNSPKLGMVFPARFIPVAEESGLIIPLGRWILRSACEQRRRWEEQGLLHFPVSVNVSPLQFRDSDLDKIVAHALRETGLAPALLDLELTESAIMHHGEETVGMLQRLKALGVTLSIDDFGTGHSSLAYLKRFPIDRLKIDQSFVRDIMSDANDLEIVKAIIALGHSLGLIIIVEGVETADQFALLKTYGCDEAQGYLIGRPAAPEELEAVLRPAKSDGPIGQPVPAVHSARQRNPVASIIPFPDRRHPGVGK